MVERLRRAYQHTPSPGSEHVSDATWELLATGELSSKERRTVFDHVASCPDCAAVYRALRVIAEEAPTFDTSAPSRVRRASTILRWRPRRTLAVAAALAATVVAVLVVRPFLGGSPSPSTEVRSGTIQTVPRLVEPTRAENGVEAANLELRWRPVDGAEVYVVEVLDAQGEPVWTSAATAARSVEWPHDPGIAPGRYYWRVTARFSDGSETRSDLAAFTLVRDSRR